MSTSENSQTNSTTKLAWRIALTSILLAHVLYLVAFWPDLRLHAGYKITSDYFPNILHDPSNLFIALILAPLLLAFTLIRPIRQVCTAAIIGAWLCYGYLLIAPWSMGSQPIAVLFWSMPFLFVLSGHIDASDTFDLGRESALLLRATFALLFFGAAAGKLTGGYSNGHVLYYFYFEQATWWPFPHLREVYDVATLKGWAAWQGRITIVGEFLIVAISLFMPRRWLFATLLFCLLGMAMMTAMVALYAIIPLFGLNLATWFIHLRTPKDSCLAGSKRQIRR